MVLSQLQNACFTQRTDTCVCASFASSRFLEEDDLNDVGLTTIEKRMLKTPCQNLLGDDLQAGIAASLRDLEADAESISLTLPKSHLFIICGQGVLLSHFYCLCFAYVWPGSTPQPCAS